MSIIKVGFTLSLITLLFFNFTNVFAQHDSLVLYTKLGCSNCSATKQDFAQSGVNYIEKTLENKEYASEMLRKLSNYGYHKPIFLPVIFLNNKLYFPAYASDTGLVSLVLSDVVDSIRYKFRKGELNLYKDNLDTKLNLVNSLSTNSECELKIKPQYLICSTYNTEKEAKVEMNKLIFNGYNFAGILYNQKQFRVFSKIYYDIATANSDLNEIRKLYYKAYLYELQ